MPTPIAANPALDLGLTVIGADPELGMQDPTGRNIARSIWNTQIGKNTPTNAPFGLDGCPEIFEMRPTAAQNPLDVVKCLHNLFATQVKKTPILFSTVWKAGGMTAEKPIGGHIHISSTSNPERTNIRSYGVRAFAQYLAPLVALIEDKKEGLARRRTGYGGTEDIRQPGHGGIEYRFPSSWITSPYVSAAVLSLAKVIADDIAQNGQTSLFVGEPQTTANSGGAFNLETIKAFNKTKLRAYFPVLWETIKRARLYPKFENHLALFPALINAGLNWFPKSGLLPAWGITPSKDPIKTLSSPIAASTICAETGLEYIPA